MTSLTDKQMKAKLDKAADLFNEVDAALKSRFGQDAFIYVESEGRFHAMKAGPKGGNGSDQNDIVISSKGARFDCGAW